MRNLRTAAISTAAIIVLALGLTACVGTRQKLTGPGVRVTPLATIKTVFTTPTVEVHDVASRGISVRDLVEETDGSVGVVVLFAGGRGVTQISDQGGIGRLTGNFLVRSRHIFWQHGFTTVVFDSPSDSSEDLRPVHHSTAFAEDVGAVIHHLRRSYGLPVWLVGTSRGTVAVAAAASRLGKNSPDGVVFTASLFEGNRTASVLDLPLEKL